MSAEVSSDFRGCLGSFLPETFKATDDFSLHFSQVPQLLIALTSLFEMSLVYLSRALDEN